MDDELPFNEKVTCPDGAVIDPANFAAAYRALRELELADRAWERELSSPERKAAWKRARSALSAANKDARGKPYPCWKCNPATGRIVAFSHILKGVCFACGGLGHRPFRGYSAQAAPDVRARRRALRAGEARARTERAVGLWLERCPLALAGLIRLGSAGAAEHERILALLRSQPESVDLLGEVARALADEPSWRSLRARRAGRCEACKRPVKVGEAIAWNPETYETWHYSCAPKPEGYLPAGADADACERLIASKLSADWPDDLVRAGYASEAQADALAAAMAR